MTKSGGALVSSAVSANEVASFKTKLALELGGSGRMLFPRSQEAVQLLHHSDHREATLPNEELRQQSGPATAVENGGGQSKWVHQEHEALSHSGSGWVCGSQDSVSSVILSHNNLAGVALVKYPSDDVIPWSGSAHLQLLGHRRTEVGHRTRYRRVVDWTDLATLLDGETCLW